MSGERHVIKGRGENRGKYLCPARLAPKAKPTEHGFVWLPEQRKASRWADPKYNMHTWGTARARRHNGYFVKLIAPRTLTREAVDEIRDFISAHAAGASDALRCYWFGGDFHDAGQDFCRDCAEKLVDEKYAADPKRFEKLFGECKTAEERYDAAIDGGFDSESDSRPACETCGVKLSGSLTDYGSDEEIRALTGDCAPTFDDVEGWDALNDAVCNLDHDDPRWRKIAKIVEAAKAGERAKAEADAARAATPGMSEARASLLTLLAARAEQKAPEPSYRLWDELQAWMLVRHNATPENVATEKRLFKEAVSFLGFCGIRAYMTNDGMGMAEAPHGTYYWPFVVEAEQRKLWRDVDMAAGRAVGLACLVSDDAPGRDANPFALDGPDASRSRAWDDGFLLGLHEASGKGGS